MAVHADMIDQSNWQTMAENLDLAKNSGVKAFYHKTTESTTYVDPLYGKRRTQAANAGLPFGGYHFARPHASSGKSQANFFLQHAAPRRGNLRPALDLEDNGALKALSHEQVRLVHANADGLPVSANFSNYGLTNDALTNWVGDWVSVIQPEFDLPPVIYTPFDLTDNFDCPLWVARYSNPMWAPRVPKPWKTWSMWQFSDGKYGTPNSAAGVGHVDLSTFNAGFDLSVLQIPEKVAPKPPPPPVVPPPKPPVVHNPVHFDNIAKEAALAVEKNPKDVYRATIAKAIIALTKLVG